jgi:hypothetical protein
MKQQDIYRKNFGLDEERKKKAACALEHALDIRKFEIGLYWQRATYFWTLITVAYAGFFAVLSADKIGSPGDQDAYAYLISIVGFVFAFAWFLANRGSKFWQENWENHVDMLEDEVIGPLYKTILRRPDDEPTPGATEAERLRRYLGISLKRAAKQIDAKEAFLYENALMSRYVTGPAQFSVSSLNAWVSLFTLFIWILLAFWVAAIDLEQPIHWLKFWATAAGIFACFAMYLHARTYSGNYEHLMHMREAIIRDQLRNEEMERDD